jgi:hypothetical protein
MEALIPLQSTARDMLDQVSPERAVETLQDCHQKNATKQLSMENRWRLHRVYC